MIRDTNKERIQRCIHMLNLNSCFDTVGLQFEVHTYKKGEQIVSPLNPLSSFLIIVSGNIRIYQLNEDSDVRVKISLGVRQILGYHEFCFDNGKYTLHADAVTSVTCLVLPFAQQSRNLKEDSRFLMYLLKNELLSQIPVSDIMQFQSSLKDRVILYIQTLCEDNRLTNVNQAVDTLHCSRRSLQRVLRQMCEENILLHPKRGLYILQ